MASQSSVTRHLLMPLLLVAGALLSGCAATSQTPAGATGRIAGPAAIGAPVSLGEAVAEVAMGAIGTRYRYGGTAPSEGFDCSGLVYYAYSQVGQRIPRTSQEQFKAARKISLGAATAGDVIFFQDQEKLSHVGIYLGDGRFVHAPTSGQRVAVSSLDSAYYQRQLVAVGRLLP